MRDTLEMTQQHHEIVSLCQQLDEAVNDHRSRPEIYGIMDDLLSRTIHHFHTEERLMAETGYPEIEQHKARHQELLDRTGRFRRQLELYGEDSFSEWFHHWPFSYIRLHIEHADNQLVEHVQQSET